MEEKEELYNVLILVVMDDALVRLLANNSALLISGLNPCFNG